MSINEETKQAYLQSRDVFVDSYVDFLRKLLGLLYDAEQSTTDAEVRQDVTRFAGDVKTLYDSIEDFRQEKEAKAGAVSSAEGARQDESAMHEDSGLSTVPFVGSAGQTTTSTRKSQSEELQAEVESQPSQLTASEETIDETPLVFAPSVADDGRVVSAFCAFRYHRSEFRQLFMGQGGNNSASTSLAAAAAAAATASEALASSGTPEASSASPSAVDSSDRSETAVPAWLGPLAHCALDLLRGAYQSATPDQWEALKRRLAGFGFKAEKHFDLWLRLSESVKRPADPARVFDAIPPLASLPASVAAEAKIMLQTLNLLSQ